MCVFGCNDSQPCFSFRFMSILDMRHSVEYEAANRQRQRWPAYEIYEKRLWTKSVGLYVHVLINNEITVCALYAYDGVAHNQNV